MSIASTPSAGATAGRAAKPVFAPIPEILEELRAGRLVVLVDDERRENEGDLICAAQRITPELVNFMVRSGGGYLCLALTGADCDRLALTPQAPMNNSLFGTPFTVSADAHPRHGVGTGVSALDRARSIRLLIDPATGPDDFVRPGHINPLRARDGGVLVRTGQTEGSVDLMRLAGMHPSAVLIEIVQENGEMARLPELQRYCERYSMKMCSIEQIIEYRLARETLVQRIAPENGTPVETPYGMFQLFAYQSSIDAMPHLVLAAGGVGSLDEKGNVRRIDHPTLVRVHRRDLLGDVFEDLSHPTARDLRESLRMIQKEGAGALVYLRPEGIGDGLRERLQRVYRPSPLSDQPSGSRDNAGQTIEQREIGIGGQILRDLGVTRLRVITNTPHSQYPGLHAFGLEIVEEVALRK